MVVEKCGALHALICGTNETGDFTLLSSFGEVSHNDFSGLDFDGLGSLAELRSSIEGSVRDRSYAVRPFPLISESVCLGCDSLSIPKSQR
jgi:hypothetical protein